MDILHDKVFELLSTVSDDVYMYICDMKRDDSRWSANTVETFGVPEYVHENGKLWLEHIHPEDRAAYLEDIEAVFSGKKPRHECEYRARTKDGSYIWLRCSGAVYRDETGEPSIFAGLMKRLDSHSQYDPVTHLRMATYENDYISHYLQSGRPCGVILLGLDGFRHIVNNYSLDFGNTILAQIAHNLTQLCQGEAKQPCVATRFIKNEFAIFLTDHTQAECEEFYQRLKIVVQHMEVEGRTVDVGLSAGGVLVPEEGMTFDMLVAKGEQALGYAKEHNKGGISFFSEDIERQQNRRAQISNALAYSINHDFAGFELYFQPIVAKSSHRMSGCETLLRWKYGTDRGIRMDETIDELERSGYINQVGDWVLDNCLKQLKVWQEAHGDFSVSINVSAIQFKDVTFAPRVIDKVKAYGIDPERLVVELTESACVENVEQVAESFRQLRDAGIRVSLDDFGTEHSTMSLLRDLPVDEVKIDQSFVLQLNLDKKRDAAIVESTIELCNKLGVRVVVEGLENQETIDIIENYDIESMQGFYFARPMPVSDFEKYIREDREGDREDLQANG